MQQEKYDIFISYRRKGGYETAKHLYDLLSRDGYSVSFDIDTLRNGDFDVELLKRVEECTDFILILNQGAFDRTIDPNYDPQKDWLRQELAHALKLGKNIIPIMLNDFTEFPDNLPSDVVRVQKKNGPKYDQYYFDDFYNKLVDIFLETPKPKKLASEQSTSSSSTGILRVQTDLDCRVFNYGNEVGVAKAGVYTTFELPLGDNDLKFVGLESDKDCYQEKFFILENHQKLVRVKLLEIHNARKVAERKAREEVKRQAYLLSLADDEFEIVRANNKYGCLIRYTGEVVVPVKYDWIGGFHGGLARVKLNGKYGFIDKTGKEITPLKYDYVDSFYDGLAKVKLNGKWGLIDKTGKDVTPMYDKDFSFHDGLAKVELNGKYGLIDKTGKEVTPMYDEDFSLHYKDLIPVQLNGKWGLIDKTGKEVTPVKYDRIGYFNDGFEVQLNGKWGLIDKTGKEVTPVKYDKIFYHNDGLAKVELNGKYGLIYYTGKEVTPVKYDYIDKFHDLWAKVILNGKYGLIYYTGKEVTPVKYDYIDEFNDGLARVNVGGKSSFFNVKGGKYGFIDTTGKEVIPVKYYSAASFKNGTALVETKNIFGVVNEFYIDKNGNKVE